MEAWSQDEAIAFECAREAITDLMAIYSARIANEGGQDAAAELRRAGWRAERSRLAFERNTLHVDAHDSVLRIRTEYGAIIRAWRAEHQNNLG